MGILEREGPPVPITVIGGFLGAGKTTLLNRIVASASGRRLGVLVNDFGEIDIDSRLIAGSADGVISLANGCVCCTIKNDVVRALFRLLERAERPEHVVLETSGISNPGAVVETFVELARTGLVRIDGVIAVIDALNFRSLERGSGSLARCQVLAADLLVLSKTDLAAAEELAAVEAELVAVAPSARIVRAVRGEVPMEVLLSIGAVHPEHEAHEDHDHSQDHGFESWSWSTLSPISFKQLAAVLKDLPPSIFRVKGILNLVERPGDRLELHVVARRIDVRTIDPFAPGETPRTELVVIGARGTLDREDLTRRFTSAASTTA